MEPHRLHLPLAICCAGRKLGLAGREAFADSIMGGPFQPKARRLWLPQDISQERADLEIEPHQFDDMDDQPEYVTGCEDTGEDY